MRIATYFLRCLVLLLIFVSADARSYSQPFKGRIVGRFAGSPTGEPGIYKTAAQATGTATQVGRFSKTTDDEFNVLTGEVTGRFEMTTATGDLLRGHYHGWVIPESSTTFSWRLDAVISGGRGSFENAGGDFTFIAYGSYYFDGDALRGEYTETFEGTINH